VTGRASVRLVALAAFTRAVEELDLAAHVVSALPPKPPSRARVRVIAAGKAAPEMARGLRSVWSSRVEHTLIVAPDGTPCDEGDTRLEVLRAGHPLPDARSVAAAERALSFAREDAKDLLVVLISGGASALLAAPIDGVTLADKVGVTKALLVSGAPIEGVNLVRRHLSRIKGGGLTRAAAPGRVLGLLASDVIGGQAHDIGSGPTASDPTTVDEARAALLRWAPSFSQLPMQETLGPGEPAARRQRAQIIATPTDLAEAVARLLTRGGFVSRVLPASSGGADELAAEYERTCTQLAPGSAVVRAAEPRIAVGTAGPGKGGRAGHVAALVGRRLRDGFVFLAGASDGVDGSSGSAGAVVDGSFRSIGDARIDEALAAFDTARLHEEAGTAIRLGPTGKNFADVHVLLRSA
jgi:glycerate 2-kinase